MRILLKLEQFIIKEFKEAQKSYRVTINVISYL